VGVRGIKRMARVDWSGIARRTASFRERREIGQQVREERR
jgi:hypothetical protein